MSFRQLLLVTLLFPMMVLADESDDHRDLINNVLDDFQDAAAHGDNARYLGHLTEDGVFMGTDEWERWPKKPDFIDYVDSRFKNGVGWNYKSVERIVRIADSADIAWFDEVTFSETNGRFRGTGVLMLESGHWKIAHYAMSFLVLNENWDEVIELTRKTRAVKESGQAPE